MNCESVRRRLIDLVYDELPAGDAAKLHEHLAACDRCGEHFSALCESRSTLGRGDEAPARISPLQVVYVARELESRRRRRRWGMAGALAACAAAMLVMVRLGMRVEVEADRIALTWRASQTAIAEAPAQDTLAVSPKSRWAYGRLRELTLAGDLSAIEQNSVLPSAASTLSDATYSQWRHQWGL